MYYLLYNSGRDSLSSCASRVLSKKPKISCFTSIERPRITQLINTNCTRKDSHSALPKCEENVKCTTLSQMHILQGGTGGEKASA